MDFKAEADTKVFPSTSCFFDMADNDIQEGDEVSWNWGGGQPTGKVAEIKTSGQLEITSNGKQVHKNADPDNPAVHIERMGNDVVKRASELNKLDSEEVETSVGKDKPSETGDGNPPVATEKSISGKPATKKRGRKQTIVAEEHQKKTDDRTDTVQDPKASGGEAEKKAKRARTTKASSGAKKSPRATRKSPRAKKSQDKQVHEESESAHVEGP